MEKDRNRDLTVGDPQSVLWRFCLPLFGSIIFQQLYNIADSLVAGKFIGENALASVGNSYEITLIFIAFAFGCNIGCSVVVSRYFGAKDYSEMKTGVSTAMLFSAALCIVLMGAGLTGGRAMLELIRTPEELMADSWVYLRIYIWGLPFLFFYNISTGIFSALGDSRTPFFFLAVSSSANILVDILFVSAFGMGVSGVAWATFLCQGISCAAALLVVFRRLAGIRTEEKVRIFSGSMLWRITVIAVPSIIQQSFVSVGNIIIQSVINGFGPGVIAGYAAAVKLNNLVVTSFTTIGNGISNFTSQNIGAGILDRVRAGFRAGVKLVWIICIPVLVLYLSAGGILVRFFMNEPSPAAMESGVLFLRIVTPFYLAVSVKLVADGVLRGAGMMKLFMAGTFTDLILRVVLAVLLADVWGYRGVWSAWPIGWCVATVVSVLSYRSGAWNRRNRQTGH